MTSPQITVRTGTIGSSHDPYATETVTVKVAGRKAVFYQDGLGRRHLWLGDLNSPKVVDREEEWFDRGISMAAIAKGQCRMTKANILFRRHVGLTIDEALRQHEEVSRDQPADPYRGYL